MLFQQRVTLPYSRVLLAVSGGLDSVCLLHWCASHAEKLKLSRIVVCHIHHGIRGKEADGDAHFVEELARQYQLPFILKKIDGLPILAAGNFESEARDLRYRFFREILKEENLEAVFTAHHANDQAETLCMRMLRGTSLQGLQGILPDRKDKVFRPLLFVSKTDLLNYATHKNLRWREDSTNREITYKRNFIRLKLLPYLENGNTDISVSLSKTAALAQKVMPRLLKFGDSLFSPALLPPSKWPFPKRYAPYRDVLAFSQKKLESVLMPLGVGGAELLRLWLAGKGFHFPLETFMLPFQPSKWNAPNHRVEKSHDTLWFYDKRKFQLRDNLYFFAENLSFLGEWRYFQNGDRFSPPGSGYLHRKLTKWLQEHGIPQWVRRSLPLLVKNSTVYWIPGVVRSDSLLKLKKGCFETKDSND
ncbi:MAG: tRNA lysidine(34) synthetase TilS [Fibrobacter sp.]|nr:tRNA lysidine(34) synthetase TilS [Fibrobacter sp.]